MLYDSLYGSQELTALVVLVILAVVLILQALLIRKEALLLRSLSRAPPFERALAEMQPEIGGIKMPKRETSAKDASLALLAAAGSAAGVLLRKEILAALPDIEKMLRKRLEEDLRKDQNQQGQSSVP